MLREPSAVKVAKLAQPPASKQTPPELHAKTEETAKLTIPAAIMRIAKAGSAAPVNARLLPALTELRIRANLRLTAEEANALNARMARHAIPIPTVKLDFAALDYAKKLIRVWMANLQPESQM